MKPQEYIAKVKQLVVAANTEHIEINARLSQSALSLIKARIINEGKDHNGKSFGKYSTNKLPFFFFQDKGLGKGADDKLAAEKKRQSKLPKKDQGLSYEGWRKINGLQTGHVDMSFTKETLNDIGLIETRGDKKIITIVASRNSILKDKKRGTKTGDVTEYLGERYGNFLQVSDEENELLKKAFDTEIQNLIDKYL